MTMTHYNLQNTLIDQFGRTKRKLRISVTDRCNFKCAYCMPEHPTWMKKQDLLSFEELYQFCAFMVHRGIESIRITGGEPLMRQGIVHFIEELQKLKKRGLKRISMTTNAHYLQKYAFALKQAGLDDINISLDSLDESQFKTLTQKEIQPVLDGIAEAQRVGLPIKINTVLIKGINEDQIIPLAEWSIQNNLMLRFIEFMPLDGNAQWSNQQVIIETSILATLEQHFTLQTQQGTSSDPARQYFINHHPIGIISTISNSFCGSCDRLRLNAKGEFFNCLFAVKGMNLKPYIQGLNTDDPSAKLQFNQHLNDYIWHKKAGFSAIQQEYSHTQHLLSSRKISMYMIGG